MNEATGDPKSASARFVANVKVAELDVLFFDNAPHRPLESMLSGGDGSVVSWFGIAITFENGDDSFCFMNVESEVECLRCA